MGSSESIEISTYSGSIRDLAEELLDPVATARGSDTLLTRSLPLAVLTRSLTVGVLHPDPF